MPQPNLNFKVKRSKLIDENRLTVGPNLANMLPKEKRDAIYLWMLQKYIYPQYNARMPYERIWRVLYDAYRMKLKISDMKWRDDEKTLIEALIERQKSTGSGQTILADTLIFDTVDRLTNLTHFMMWKGGSPVEFNIPQYRDMGVEDSFYAPTADKHKASNCVFQWNAEQQDYFRKSRIQARNWWLYGFGFALSDVEYELIQDPQTQEITLQKYGVTYEPISIKQVWVNWLIPISKMEMQPCPFWYEYTADFAILQNEYDPALRPFGYVNLDEVVKYQGSAPLTSEGEQEFRKAVEARLADWGQGISEIADVSRTQARALWTFKPMLPLDPNTGDWIIYSSETAQKMGTPELEGKPVPYKRFTWQQYGAGIFDFGAIPINIQYRSNEEKMLPLYGSTHLEDLDSGAYPMSIAEALMDYYIQITTCINQFVENKNKINNPPTKHLLGDPSISQDCNRGDEKIIVGSPNGMDWRMVPDATGQTVNMAEFLSRRAKTTSKATEAIMGQALGDRTTATEAQNIFQTSMSGITTDIDIYNKDFSGGFADRTLDCAVRYFDVDLAKHICGSYGLAEISIDELTLRSTLVTNVGATFIESIARQQHLRYFMETVGMMAPGLMDMGQLIRAYALELRMPEVIKAIMPDPTRKQIAIATEQAISTYLDRPFMISPTQMHEIAIQVKIAFLEDTESNWNVKYGDLPYAGFPNLTRKQAIAQQIQLHQNYQLVQMQQMQKVEFANLQNQQAQLSGEQIRSAKFSQNSGDALKSGNPRSNNG